MSDQSGPAARPAKTFAELVMSPVVYRLDGMDDAKIRPDLKYSQVDNPFLLMDVYTPPDLAPDERRPVVIFVSGGAGAQYRPKDWGIFQSWARLIAAFGLIGVTFTHRLGYPEPFLAEAAADLQSALNYVRANAASLNADPDRICLMAFSAGGPLLTASMREKPRFVRCLVAFYAFLGDQPSDPIQAFSPLSCLQGDASSMIPVFVARAGRDQFAAMNDAMDRFVTAALAGNAPVTVMNHPSGEHGFDNQNDNERSREIIRAALEFMKTHLFAPD